MAATSNDQLTRFHLSNSSPASTGTMSTNVGVADEHIESEDISEHKGRTRVWALFGPFWVQQPATMSFEEPSLGL
jgi:hypothetical protein